ncbi:serine O-acetyltransferase [Christiangramia sediminis]|uniref:Serine acetyltransferase n=1 Tax=Christiangramia sediminis TaxID=2881336 RepID=A0A9X1LJ40_9FLAO|nr:serine O-acetyltransferase [Christiangramia sediminis]MCB7481313.1 serine O-acetyltransferase [Christiangramia sediminis]
MPRFRDDLKKYKEYSGKSSITLLLTQQSLWAIFIYRMSNGIFKSSLPKPLKRILLIAGVFLQKIIEILTGISIPYSAKIGKEFYIGHFGGVIINSRAIIGDNCNVSQGVTIGVSGRKNNRGVPKIGNNVYIGVNSVIAGPIEIGDNSVIGANSLVITNVPKDSTVLGVPASKISNKTSQDYI